MDASGHKTPANQQGGLRKGFLGGGSGGSRGELKGSGVPLDPGERAVFFNEMGYPVKNPQSTSVEKPEVARAVDEEVSEMLGRASATELEGYIQFLKDIQASKSGSGPVLKIQNASKDKVNMSSKKVDDKSVRGDLRPSNEDESWIQVPPRKRRP